MSWVVKPPQPHLVLQLVKSVLAIAAVPVELSDGSDVVLRVGRQHGVLPQLRRLLHVVVPERQHELLFVPVFAPGLGHQGQVVADAATQHHHAPRTAPAAQPQLVFAGLPALATHRGLAPGLAFEQPLDQSLDVGSLAQGRAAAGNCGF